MISLGDLNMYFLLTSSMSTSTSLTHAQGRAMLRVNDLRYVYDEVSEGVLTKQSFRS